MAKLKATPKSYADAVAVLKGKQSVRLGNNTYLELTGSDPVHDYVAVRLHDTHIVKFWTDGQITLHTGGWRSVTTKDRINEFIRGRVQGRCETQGWSAGNWYYHTVQGTEVEFKEGLDVSQYYPNPPLHLQERVVTDEPDFRIQDEGSIVILYALTDAAKQWVAEHLPTDAQTWGANGIVIEPRYIVEIVDGISADGLIVIYTRSTYANQL